MGLLIFVYQKLPLNNMKNIITLINLVFLSLWVIPKFGNGFTLQALKHRLKSVAFCKFFYESQTIHKIKKTNFISNLFSSQLGFNQIANNYNYSLKYENILKSLVLERRFKFIIS